MHTSISRQCTEDVKNVKCYQSSRREVYKKVSRGREDLWDEYRRLHKEVKELVRQKKLTMWKEVVEKAKRF